MFKFDDALTSPINTMAREAAHDLFAHYNVPLSDTVPQSGSLTLCAALGFIGSTLRGTCLLATSQEPLERSNPGTASSRDWLGELSNQLVGRLKNKLLGRGVEVSLSTPILLRGEHLAPMPRRTIEPISFDADPGVVLVWLELEVTSAFELGEADDDAAMAEGDAMLF